MLHTTIGGMYMDNNWDDSKILSELQNPTSPDKTQQAWNALVSRYHTRLIQKGTWILRNTRDDMSIWAEELAQETWIKVRRGIKTCSGHVCF